VAVELTPGGATTPALVVLASGVEPALVVLASGVEPALVILATRR